MPKIQYRVRHLTLGLQAAALLSGCERVSSHVDVPTCASNPNSNPAVAASDTATYALVRKIGAAEDDTTVTFGWIADIDTDSKGSVYVVDGLSKTISVFDRSGVLIRRFGREGAGPGEFRAIVALRVIRGDTVKIFDSSLWRVTTFDSMGHVISTASPRRLPDLGQIPEAQFSADGTLFYLDYGEFDQGVILTLDNDPAGVVRAPTTIESWDGKTWRKLLSVPGVEVFAVKGEGLWDVPFARRPLWAVGTAGELWYGDSGKYAFTLYSATGRPTCRVQRDYAPRAVTSRERRRYYEARDISRRDARVVAQIRRERRSIPMPAYKPVVDRMLVTDRGDLFVRVVPGDREDTIWHDVSKSGRITVAKLPRNLEVKSVRGSYIYGTIVDKEGVNFVGVYARQ